MLGPAGKPIEPPSSPTNPLRKFTGKVAQVASQLSQKSMPRLRPSTSTRHLNNSTSTRETTTSGSISTSTYREASSVTNTNRNSKLHNPSMASKTSSPALSVNSFSSTSAPSLVLYWDVRVPKDNQIYDRFSKLLDNDVSRSKYPEVYSNISLLLEQFPQVHVLNTFQSLAQQLFAYRECAFTTLFYVTTSDLVYVNDDQTIKFVSAQYAHIPGAFIVLSDVTSLWASFARLGAMDISWASIESVKATKPAYWASIIGHARQDQFESRTRQLKTMLGLEQEVESVASANLITKFSFSSKHVLDEFSPSLTSLVNEEKQPLIQELIGSWDFYAHDLKYDELLAATYMMIKHALSSPGLEHYCIPDRKLISLLLVVRNCYHATNPYHNFRHAVDVVQATFFFLISIGVFKPVGKAASVEKSTNPLTAVDGLNLLVAALGHDVGHPGVTNAFLVSSNAPLAKIYNDRSVLESYHSAAFNQILKEYWPQMVQDSNARTMITESVLATDMAVHFDYMKKAEEKGKQDSLYDENINENELQKLRLLLGCLILKCADISNVSRKLDISSKWGTLLVAEFGGLNDLEIDLGLKQAPSQSNEPVTAGLRNKLLGEGQIFFIETYALPLFTAVSRMMPELQFATRQIEENVKIWKSRVGDGDYDNDHK
ncbi:3',5'-cyclic-nucleotide phosphodiesterase PDE2 [Sugiyamaella lignohabitans]|uniref:Phosphodiesterase n=1 Tax=Sugiyamaella lignohabitans TaxID=796027 RepID=A0A167ERC1_9ASCO|nr:3',5'-cyclic-nucleotide phosphodiesterase PDE2 [Sugiyamaella lignohabitans]ANB14382.1 3',5'-cyclic-nucleotide phosphodiesterase PDE2 [Sugiyamaella lignohabitans]